MRLRSKFIGIYTLIFSSVVLVVVVSVLTQNRLDRIAAAMTYGDSILAQSRRVRQTTKDVMIGAFAPEAYTNLKDVLYFDVYTVALRTWRQESDRFKELFGTFIADPILLEMVRRGVLKDEYETALIMSQKAFTSLEDLQNRVLRIRDRGLLGEDLYVRIQRSSDPELIALFEETRQTTYYLANSFESYLQYFIASLAAEATVVRSQLVASFIILGLGTAVLATLITLIFSSRIVRRLRTLGRALHRVSLGDFSTPLRFDAKDEFDELAANFNRYTDALKVNLGAMVSLVRDVAGAALAVERTASADRSAIIDLVLKAIVDSSRRNADAETAALVSRRDGVAGIRFRSSALPAVPVPVASASGSTVLSTDALDGLAPETEAALLQAVSGLENSGGPCVIADGRTGGLSVLAGSLSAADRSFGVLMLASRFRSFNDLDLIRFENYLEFAGLLADNAATYVELMEERNAEYLALQSQVQPHFLYNVLGGFAGLNRLGDRETLEKSILALKDLLRYTVDHSPETTVAEEFRFLERYCQLQRMRFQERLNWSIEAADETLNRRIPKLILQPLVENAIIHGIEPTGDVGHLNVRALTDSGGAVVVTVEDDGAGFDPERLVKGVGLGNVERRLALAYPGAKGESLQIVSRPGGGTRIVARFPEDA